MYCVHVQGIGLCALRVELTRSPHRLPTTAITPAWRAALNTRSVPSRALTVVLPGATLVGGGQRVRLEGTLGRHRPNSLRFPSFEVRQRRGGDMSDLQPSNPIRRTSILDVAKEWLPILTVVGGAAWALVTFLGHEREVANEAKLQAISAQEFAQFRSSPPFPGSATEILHRSCEGCGIFGDFTNSAIQIGMVTMFGSLNSIGASYQ